MDPPAAAPSMQLFPVVGQRYCALQSTHYFVYQSHCCGSDGSFDVVNADDTDFLRVDARSFSWKNKHVFADSTGHPVMCMKRKRMSRPDTWEVLEGESISKGRLLFTVTVSSTGWFRSRRSLSVFLSHNRSQLEPDFVLQTSNSANDFEVYYRNQRVAEVRYISSFWEKLKGLRKLSMVVYPGYDSAFVTALMVIVEYLDNESRRSSQATAAAAASASATAASASASAAASAASATA